MFEERDPSWGARKIKVKKKWYRGENFGHDVFDAVLVECDSDVSDTPAAAKAVKKVSKTLYEREASRL